MSFAGRLPFRRFMCLMVRQNFSSECEKALNKQIYLELKACYDYLAMAYHFDRSDVALPGIYGFFKAASDEEREHAKLIMQYINKRGGQICLEELPAPKLNFANAKDAMIEALHMEKTVNESLLSLHTLAAEQNDPNLCDFIESNFLQEQVNTQKQLADYITQIERCEKSLGTYIVDLELKGHNMHKK